jgi:hypothetical protein
MSAKNSALALPARKMTVWYLLNSSSPAMSAYVLQGVGGGGSEEAGG